MTSPLPAHGGYIVTPNIDHIVMAQHDPEVRAVYAERRRYRWRTGNRWCGCLACSECLCPSGCRGLT